MKLEDFRLETYNERMAMQHALLRLRSDDPDSLHKAAIDALLLRLSKTQCQPGGCQYCDGSQEDQHEDRID